MIDDNVKFVELRCPRCNQLLMRVAGFGCIVEIQCWRNDCSKPLLRYPSHQFEILKREPKKNEMPLDKVIQTLSL